MKVYDDVLGKEENVHELVKPEVEKEIRLKEPDAFKNLFEPEEEENEQ